MEKATIDSAAMGRLAKALVFICGADHPTTVALRAAAESGSVDSAEPTPIPMAIIVQIASRPGFARWQESLLANGLHATIAAVPAKVYAEALRTFPERMHSPAQDFVMVTVVVAGHSNASA